MPVRVRPAPVVSPQPQNFRVSAPTWEVRNALVESVSVKREHKLTGSPNMNEKREQEYNMMRKAKDFYIHENLFVEL